MRTEWQDLRVGEVVGALGRHRGYAAVVGVVAVLAVLLPGARSSDDAATVGAGSNAATVRAGQGVTAGTTGGASSEAGATAGTGGRSGGGARPGEAGSGAGATRAAGEAAPTPPPPAATGGDPLANPGCDATLGRMAIPSIFSAPCVPDWPQGADNGAATWRGVSGDEIIIAIRRGEANAAVQAILIGAGAEDTEEEVVATRQGWVDLYQHHYETYGRKVKLVYFDETGDDDEADRADALKVATEIKAFAAWGGGGAYRDELVARGVVCLCDPISPDQAEQFDPLLWGTPVRQLMLMWAEYLGKKVVGGNADHAGNVEYTVQPRRLGLVHIDSDDGVLKREVDYFESELARYGGQLATRISYISDIDSAQEQARTIIARLKEDGITSVLFYGDPLAPIFFTQEATNQQYFPEWIIGGDNLVDTSFFGRTYDQVQWEHAFGHSELWARAPQPVDEVYHLYEWHYGEPAPARATYEIIYQNVFVFLTAVHLAGADLNPTRFRDALFSYPVSGGGPTSPQRSWGRHGFFPWVDYGRIDDSTEVWWDPNAVGENEIGQQGKGMWRYVDGGRRYTPGTWPAEPTRAFDPEGTITRYEELPPEDQYPHYDCRECPGS
jgi:hypothetical protein